MAKAAPVPLHADTTFAEAAQRTVAVRAGELWEHSEGVLDTTDIERVHDMRVATRRLRAVLEIFAPCFPRDEHKAVLREVKKLADALGARRDPDIQLEALGDRPGVAAFAERLRDEQEEANDRLREALRRADDLRPRLEALVA